MKKKIIVKISFVAVALVLTALCISKYISHIYSPHLPKAKIVHEYEKNIVLLNDLV